MRHDEIRALRAHLGLTQREFAEQIGTTITTVHRWEHGLAAPLPIYLKKLNELARRAGKGTP